MSIYSVLQGDTLYGIARKSGISYDQLLSYNSGISDPNKINVGQQINLSDPTKIAPTSGYSSIIPNEAYQEAYNPPRVEVAPIGTPGRTPNQPTGTNIDLPSAPDDPRFEAYAPRPVPLTQQPSYEKTEQAQAQAQVQPTQPVATTKPVEFATDVISPKKKEDIPIITDEEEKVTGDVPVLGDVDKDEEEVKSVYKVTVDDVKTETGMSIQELIAQYGKAYTANLVANLQADYDKKIAELDKQYGKIRPKYDELRNVQDAQSRLGIKNMNEYLAYRGYGTGDIIGRNVGALAASQGALSRLTVAQRGEEADIESTRYTAYSDLLNGITKAKAEGDMVTLEKLINQVNADRNLQFKIDELNANLSEKARQFDTEMKLKEQQFGLDQYKAEQTAGYQQGQLNVDYAQLGLDQYKAEVDAAYKSGLLSIDEANQLLKKAEFEAAQKIAEGSTDAKKQQEAEQKNANYVLEYINKTFYKDQYVIDAYGDNVKSGKQVLDTAKAKNYISTQVAIGRITQETADILINGLGTMGSSFGGSLAATLPASATKGSGGYTPVIPKTLPYSGAGANVTPIPSATGAVGFNQVAFNNLKTDKDKANYLLDLFDKGVITEPQFNEYAKNLY